MKLPVFKDKYKTAGLVILLVPILILFSFAVGEGLSPEFGMSGFLLHFIQALPLVIIFYIAYRWPKAGGRLLSAIGTLLAVIYLTMTVLSGQVVMGITTVFIIFAPPVVSGFLLMKSKSASY